MHTKKTKPGRPAKNLSDFQKVTLKIGVYCLVRMVLVFRLKRTTTWNDLQYREAIDVNGRQQPYVLQKQQILYNVIYTFLWRTINLRTLKSTYYLCPNC